MNRFITLLRISLLCCAASGTLSASVAKPTCGGTSSSKSTQLLAPKNAPRQCVYHFSAYSSYVCQLRIDFAMTLAQPSRPAADNDLTYAKCVDDYFQVGDLRLCGTETSQHIYVNFNRTAGVTKLDLEIVLAARTGWSDLPTASWDMLVTQLECPAGASVRQLDFEPSPNARASTIKDGFFVAPPGCLQYFPQSMGAFTSFNYYNGNGIYPGELNYAICFRRGTETEGLELQSHFFQLGSEYTDSRQLELDNYCYSHLRTSGISEDYLMIPQATIEENDVRATYFCGESAQGVTIRSTNPGPLMMVFNSDGVYKQNEAGFDFSYRLL